MKRDGNHKPSYINMKETSHQFTSKKKITNMFPSSRYLFSFVLIVFLVHLCDGGIWFIPKKVDIRITNDLGDDSTLLNLHCKSKDDDLGIQTLEPHFFFEFGFKPNFWSTTLFFCTFWWGNESHSFDIYEQNRDIERCSDMCWWRVGKAGPCLLNNKVKRYTYCENWNPNQLQGLNQMGARNNTAGMYNEGGEKRGK